MPTYQVHVSYVYDESYEIEAPDEDEACQEVRNQFNKEYPELPKGGLDVINCEEVENGDAEEGE